MVQKNTHEGPIERRGAEHVEALPTAASPFSQETLDSLKRVRRILAEAKDSVLSEGRDLRKEVAVATREENNKSRYTLTAGHNDLAWSDYNESPAGEYLISEFIEPMKAQEITKNKADIREKHNEEPVAKLAKREEKVEGQVERRYANIYAKTFDRLEEENGEKPHARRSLYGQAAAAIVLAPAVQVGDSSAETPQEGIDASAESNVEASQSDELRAVTPPSRKELQAKAEQDGQTEIDQDIRIDNFALGASKRVRFNDVEVDEAVVDSPVDSDIVLTPFEAVESLRSDRIEKSQPKGFFGKVKARWNKLAKNERGEGRASTLAIGALAIGAATLPGKLPTRESMAEKVANNKEKLNTLSYKIGTRMVHSRVNEYFADSDKGFKRRLGLRAAMIVGGVAVGYALGHHGFGGGSSQSFQENSGTEQDNIFDNNIFDKDSSTDGVDGQANGTTFGPEAPDVNVDSSVNGSENPSGVEQPGSGVETPQPVEVTGPRSEFIPDEITLQSGDTVSDHVADYINDAYPDASTEQVERMVRVGSAHVMYGNDMTMDDTHNLAAGTPLDTESLVKAFPGQK